MQRHRQRRHWAHLLVAAAILLAGTLAWPSIEAVTVGTPPHLVDRPDGTQRLQGHTTALGVAHNAGNRVHALAEAQCAGAEVMEVDVIQVAAELRAGRERPLPLIGEWAFRGPTLDRVWRESVGMAWVKLDLKESSPHYLDQVIAFVSSRSGTPHTNERQVMVSSRSPAVLAEVRQRAPGAIRLLSIGSRHELDRLSFEPTTLESVNGVSVYHELLDLGTLRRLGDNGRLVLAWTVNDPARAAELIQAGVDGITTDNLAILRALRTTPTSASAPTTEVAQPVPPGCPRTTGNCSTSHRSVRVSNTTPTAG